MKKLLAILLVVMLLVSTANAQDDGLHSVLVRKPVDAAVVPVGPKVVTPYVLGVRVYQPFQEGQVFRDQLQLAYAPRTCRGLYILRRFH